MKTIITTLVRKVLAIHPDDRVSRQEIVFTLFAIAFMLLFFGLLVKSLLIHGY